jgi:DNA polymerase-3 subunit epsilon
MKTVAIDFGTANHSPLSACALGLATFEQGQLTESKHWLVKPPKGHGWFIPEWTQDSHGLSWFAVRHQPEFSAISGEVLARLARADVVIAHNTAFDLRVLDATLGSAVQRSAAYAPATSLGMCGRSCLTIGSTPSPRTLATPSSITRYSPMLRPPAACCWQS